MTDETAVSGKPADIQVTVNRVAASGEGNVHIPQGAFGWNGETVTVPTGVDIFGASLAGCQGHQANWLENAAATILHNMSYSVPMFYFVGTGRSIRKARIAGLRLEHDASLFNPSSESGGGITFFRAEARVDHITFHNMGNIAAAISNTDDMADVTDRLLVDHCLVDNPYKIAGQIWSWGYGVYSVGAVQRAGAGSFGYTDAYWGNAQDWYGKWDTTPQKAPIMYVEDCHFRRVRHGTDCIQGGFYVSRYNLFDQPIPHNFGQIDHHGTETDASGGLSYIGGRGFEAYENIIIGESGYYSNAGIWTRGGSSIVFNNQFLCDLNEPYNIFNALSNDDVANLYPKTQVNQTYIWNNTVPKGSMLSVNPKYVENIDYFLRAPNQTQDGFQYIPYPYPHPLTLETQGLLSINSTIPNARFTIV